MAGQIGVKRSSGAADVEPDAQLAGIAAVYGLTLVTRNVRDFLEASGVDLLEPRGSADYQAPSLRHHGGCGSRNGA
ncbi:MAG: hypothetical protein IPM67_15215 [Sphingomonadales bacterium]|nr:hypothetical protein [Sphingomonadales bacterium]